MGIDIFAGDISLADGMIDYITLLPEQTRVYFTSEQGQKHVLVFKGTAAVWDRNAAGQEIGGMITQPTIRTGVHIREALAAAVRDGDMDQQTLEQLSVYSFVSSWSEQSILDIAAVEMEIEK